MAVTPLKPAGTIDCPKSLCPHATTRNWWPALLFDGYQNVTILRCPSDVPFPLSTGSPASTPPDLAPRSYIFNGWNDFFGTYRMTNSISETPP